jgi:hypothetical protein
VLFIKGIEQAVSSSRRALARILLAGCSGVVLDMAEICAVDGQAGLKVVLRAIPLLLLP